MNCGDGASMPDSKQHDEDAVDLNGVIRSSLITGTEATVVPAGTFAKMLAQVKPTARYQRKGGLYVATMQAVDPKTKRRKPSGFTRPGRKA